MTARLRLKGHNRVSCSDDSAKNFSRSSSTAKLVGFAEVKIFCDFRGDSSIVARTGASNSRMSNGETSSERLSRR